MVYDPNAAWTAAIGDSPQKPQYFMRFDGINSVQYSTHPIKSSTRTTKVYLEVPVSSRGVIDLQQGTSTTMSIECVILDIDGEMSALVAWDRTGAPLPTLISARIQIFGGYAHLAEADYAPIFTGRVRNVEMTSDLVAFKFTILDFTTQFDQEIMLNATKSLVSRITGNVVNVVWSIMTGNFSESDPDFPLVGVSTLSESLQTSVPTGLSIPAADIDKDALIIERERWFPNLDVVAEFTQPEEGRAVLELEFMRAFSMFLTVTGDGKVGFKHRIPVLPASSATVLDETLLSGIKNWKRRLDLHANRFRFFGDFRIDTGKTSVLYEDDTAADLQDRIDTAETISMEITSNWIRSDLNGAIIAAILSSRNRFLFQSTPATFSSKLLFTQRNLEIGDSVSLTHPSLPNLSTGERGIVKQIFMIIGMQPNFKEGVMEIDLLDTRYLRYGIIGASLPDYQATSDEQKKTYTFIGQASDNRLGSPLVDGYRII